MKNLILKILAIIIIVSLNGCSSKDEKVSVIKEKDINLQMIDSYKEGVLALEKGDALYAVKKFNEAELLYPQSEWAPKSALMASYAYYSRNYYGDAISELERFLKTYPNSKNISYVHFLLAMCYYESIIDEKKDLEPLLKAQKIFNLVIKNYPTSDFAMDATFKLGLIEDVLASKEMYIGKHYLKKEKWIAAINRFKTVVNDYDTTVYTEEALLRLVEVHYKIGLIDESKRYAVLLGYNYQSSEWYKESYRIFNKNYKDPISKMKKDKKNKKSIIKRFKSLFD